MLNIVKFVCEFVLFNVQKVITVFFQSRNSNIFNTRLGFLYFCLRHDRPLKSLHVRFQISLTRYHPNITNIIEQILKNWIFEYFCTSDMLPGIVKATNATALKQETEGALCKNITNISKKCHKIFPKNIVKYFPKKCKNIFKVPSGNCESWVQRGPDQHLH